MSVSVECAIWKPDRSPKVATIAAIRGPSGGERNVETKDLCWASAAGIAYDSYEIHERPSKG